MERSGQLAREFCNMKLPLKVLKSAAGYYIGTYSDEEGPISRESMEYFGTKEQADNALQNGDWTQREAP